MKLQLQIPTLLFAFIGSAAGAATPTDSVLEDPGNNNNDDKNAVQVDGGGLRGSRELYFRRKPRPIPRPAPTPAPAPSPRRITASSRNSVDRGADGTWNLAGIGDIDGDGSDDLVWQHSSTSLILSWLLTNDGRNAEFYDRVIDGSADGPSSSWTVVDVKDFDGDGIDDVLVKGTNGPDNVCMVWFLNSLGQYSGHHDYVPHNCLTGGRLRPDDSGAAYTHDIYDIVLSSHNGGSSAESLWVDYMNRDRTQDEIYPGLGDGRQVDFLSAWEFIGTADLGGNFANGKFDALVFQEKSSRGMVHIWYGETAKHSKDIGAADLTGWKLHGMGDVNGDNIDDFIFQHKTNGQVHAWLMDPNNYGNIMESVDIEDPVGSDWKFAGLGDFNGDNKSDLVWRHRSNGEVNIWLM